MESANLAVAPKFPAFLHVLTVKLTPKEKSALFKAVEMPKAEIEQMRNAEPGARKLEHALKSPRVRKPSHIYQILADARPDEMAFLLGTSAQRTVQERIRNYLQKYLPAMQEAPAADWQAIEGEPGTPKYNRSRQAFLAAHLDVRPPKPELELEAAPSTPAPPVQPEVVARGRGR